MQFDNFLLSAYYDKRLAYQYMMLELAGKTLVNMNQIRKDSFCKKIGGEINAWSMGVKSGLGSGSAIPSQLFAGETAR